MYTPVSIKSKRYFMKWFLKHFTLKKLEATWLINYLIKQDNLLSKVVFVSDIRSCPRAIVMTSKCSKGIPFLFYKQHLVTDDIDKFFHDIRLHEDDEIYIQLNFNQANQNPFYAAVLEENPFAPTDPYMTQQDQDISDSLLRQLLQESQIKKLKQDIDQALDEKNESQFKKLVALLHKLEKDK